MRHRRRRCAIRGALTGDFQPSSCLDASLHTRQHLGAREPRAAPGSTCFQQQRQQRQPRRRALCARASLSCRGTPPRPTYKSWFSYSFRVSKRTGAHCRLCPNGGPTWPRVSSSPRARPQPRVNRAMHREPHALFAREARRDIAPCGHSSHESKMQRFRDAMNRR